MGVLDFLFEGKPPKSTTTYGSTTENVPKWMSDYTQGLIARANAVAAEPYQAYGGPRIAGFTPDQLSAFNKVREGIGAGTPMLEEAGSTIRGGLETSPLQAAAPYLETASRTFPGSVSEYMNPYVENVLNRQATMANRTLTEDFLPALQKAFIGAGQFGSYGGRDSMQEMGLKGVRDISQNLEEQRLATLGEAYNQAGRLFGEDATRAGQLASTAGQLETAGGELALRGGEQLGALAQVAQKMGLTDTAALEAIGKEQQQMGQGSLDLAYQDFQNQVNYPKTQTQFMSEMIRGLPSSATPSMTSTTSTGPASVYGASPLSQLAGLASGYAGLKEAGVFRRGGLARCYKDGGLVIEGDYEVLDDVPRYATGGKVERVKKLFYVGGRSLRAMKEGVDLDRNYLIASSSLKKAKEAVRAHDPDLKVEWSGQEGSDNYSPKEYQRLQQRIEKLGAPWLEDEGT